MKGGLPMVDKKNLEIYEPVEPEIEQENIPEIEQQTEHPEQNDVRVQSEEIRYKNADRLYD